MLDEIIDAVRRKFNLEVWGWERNMGLGMRFLDCFFDRRIGKAQE
jgi:hypothetical protein